MSSNEIKKALSESGLSIPAGGVDLLMAPVASCTWSCKDSCSETCADSCSDSCTSTAKVAQQEPTEPIERL